MNLSSLLVFSIILALWWPTLSITFVYKKTTHVCKLTLNLGIQLDSGVNSRVFFADSL